MLTKRQSKLLCFIESYLAEHGYTPSYQEMAAHLELRSRSNIHRLLSGLRERGAVEWRPRSARSVKITKPQTHLNADYERGYKDGYAAGYEEGLDEENKRYRRLSSSSAAPAE